MKRYIAIIIACVAISACGDDYIEPSQKRSPSERAELARDCVESGGTPIFTADQSGNIAVWIGCQR